MRLRLPCSPSVLPVLSLYADDTSAIVSTDTAIRATFDTYTLFEKGSGWQLLNLSKCKGGGGGWGRGVVVPTRWPVNIIWTSTEIKVLGIYWE